MKYPGLSLEGRVAVVIGGSSGMGKHLALGSAQAGAGTVACLVSKSLSFLSGQIILNDGFLASGVNQ